jgi:hypothetical protein
MAFDFLKCRWQKIVFVITLCIAIVIAIIAFLINLYWSPILANKVQATILASTDSLYSVSFSDASLHILRQRIEIDNIELKPNMAVYNRRKKLHLAPNSLYDLKIKRLVLTNIHPIDLYYKKLDINDILISSPTLHVAYEQNRTEDTLSMKFPYQIISKVLKSAHVKSIALSNIKFKYTDHLGAKPYSFEIDDLNFTATEFLLDSLSQYDKSRFLFCKDLGVELNNYEGTTDNKLYHYKIDNLTFSTLSKQLNITGINFYPLKKPADFFKSTIADCFAVKLDSLQLNDFDFKLYNKFHKIYASKLSLGRGSLQVFDNPRPGDSTTDRAGSFPHVLLGKINNDIRVDTVSTNKVGIYYTEYGNDSQQQGTVSFTNTTGSFFNVTNNTVALAKNNILTAKLQSYLMGYGKMDVQMAFNLTDSRALFSYKGHMAPMDLRKVNPVAAPLGMVKISSGKLRSLDFDIHADKTVARGDVTVLYNDLKISVLKKDDENKLKKMGIMSLLANTLVIKRNNPTEGEDVRSFSVNYVRKKTQSIFTFMWKSLFSGLKSTAGYDAATEQTVKKKITDFKQGKAERQAKKALRIQHRAERRQQRELRQQQREVRKQQEAQIPM